MFLFFCAVGILQASKLMIHQYHYKYIHCSKYKKEEANVHRFVEELPISLSEFFYENSN